MARAASRTSSDLERTYGVSGLAPDVRAFVALALERRWLELRA